MDSGDGASADFDGDLDGGDTPFQLFSFRNLINFALGFGWTGVTCYDLFENKNMVVVLALVVGAAFVAMFFIMMRLVMRLAEDNTVKPEMLVGKTGQVYLSVPAEKSGAGKVQVSVKGSVQEINAVTSGERIETGTMVRIVSLLNTSLVEVEKL